MKSRLTPFRPPSLDPSSTSTTPISISGRSPEQDKFELPPPSTSKLPYSPTSPQTPLREIGRGAFGIVYLGTDHASGKQFVLKKMNAARLLQRNQGGIVSFEDVGQHSQELLQEANTLKMLDGVPGVPKLIDEPEVNHDDNIVKIKMEALPGGSLAKQTLDEATTKVVMKQLLTSIHEAHKRGIAHLDIKPDNLLFDPESQKLGVIDWGIAVPTHAEDIPPGTEKYRPGIADSDEVLGRRFDPAFLDTYAIGKTCQALCPNAGEQGKDFIHACCQEGRPMTELLQHDWFKD